MKAILTAIAVLSTSVLGACGSDGGAGDQGVESASPTVTTTGTQVSVPGTDLVGAPSPQGAPATVGGTSAPAPAPSPTTDPGGPTTTPTPAPVVVGMPYRGVNLSGGEFGSAIPGIAGKDYTFPTNAEVDYYMSKGMTTFRVGFLWERLQAAAYGELESAYAARLDAIVTYASTKGAKVIIEPHNFARYYGSTVGSAQVPNGVFADFWKRVSTRYASDMNVMFNLVNEPHDINSEQWVGAANAAIAAIRAAGAHNAIVVPGNAWTGAHAWYATSYGTSNAVALLNVVDPENNMIFEAHQYLDSNSSGGGSTCVSSTIGSERLAPFVKWLRDNGKKGMVGEFAGANNPTCNAAVTDMLAYMKAQPELVGWLWWGAGPGWGEYQFTLEPKGTTDRPQMALLLPFLGN